MARLFAALRPSAEAVEHLVSALRPIRQEYGRWLRWTDPDNWHLTLAFYGEQPNDAHAVTEHMATVARGYGPLELALKGAGSFSRRTLWIGVGGDTTDLRYLMAESLLEPEERHRQRAHLTVARSTERTEFVVGDVARALAVYEGPSFVVDEVEVIQSHLGEGRGGGPRYEVLDRIRLS